MNEKDLCVRVALFLEEFDYVTEHRPGKSVLHVDALSRNPLPVCMIIDEHDSLTVKFKQAQQNDLVAIKRTQLGPGFKLANKYLGSYNIVKVLRNNRYIVHKVSEHERLSKTST